MMMLNELNDDTFLKDIHYMPIDHHHHHHMAMMIENLLLKNNIYQMIHLVEELNLNNHMDLLHLFHKQILL
jgi:hypothetical protein